MTELACGQEEKSKRRQEGKRRRKTDARRGECGGQGREVAKEQSGREGANENSTSVENRTMAWGSRKDT